MKTQQKSASHTPGPWRVSQGGKFVQLCVHGTIFNICEMPPLNGDDGRCAEPLPLPSALMEAKAERKANAHLISAAPDLLEALRGVLAMLELLNRVGANDPIESRVFQARAAIAKATGN